MCKPLHYRAAVLQTESTFYTRLVIFIAGEEDELEDEREERGIMAQGLERRSCGRKKSDNVKTMDGKNKRILK